MAGNYVQFDRSLLDWRWFKTNGTFKVWIYILLKANWKRGYFKREIVERGSFVTTVRHIADDTGLAINTVRTALNNLEETGEIVVKSTRNYSLVTVLNYEKYQGCVSKEVQRIDTPTDTDRNKKTSKQIKRKYKRKSVLPAYMSEPLVENSEPITDEEQEELMELMERSEID